MKVIWFKQALKDVPDSLDWLHASEREVCATFKFSKRKNDWLLGRWTAKNVVKFYLKDDLSKLDLDEIQVISAEDGAPEVYSNAKKLPVCISISHSNCFGFCAASDPGYTLGCDLEKVEDRSPLFVEDYFTQKEKNQVSKLETLHQSLGINLIWSAKESALKALRSGLRIDTRKVEVEFSAQREELTWSRLHVNALDQGFVFHGFWKVDSEFVYTIVSEKSRY